MDAGYTKFRYSTYRPNSANILGHEMHCVTNGSLNNMLQCCDEFCVYACVKMQLKAEKAGKRGIAPGPTQRARPPPRSSGTGAGPGPSSSTRPGAVPK